MLLPANRMLLIYIFIYLLYLQINRRYAFSTHIQECSTWPERLPLETKKQLMRSMANVTAWPINVALTTSTPHFS